MAGKVRDLTGQRFGPYLVVKQDGWYVNPTTKQRQALWSCECECGTNRLRRGADLTGGVFKKCTCQDSGVFKKGHTNKRVNGKKQAERKFITSIKASAKQRNLSFKLTIKEILKIGNKPCFYCGKSGDFRRTANAYKADCAKNGHTFDELYFESKIVPLNGIDRVDNSKGYIEGNCVSCCTQCNTAKMAHTQEEFLAWAKRLVAHQKKKGSKHV